MSQNNTKPNKKYIGKVKEITGGPHGSFFKAMIDNPKPTKSDGAGGAIPDPYYKGSLIWIDGQTGKKYLVKGIAFGGVNDQSKQNGFIFSLAIDYDDSYLVEELS